MVWIPFSILEANKLSHILCITYKITLKDEIKSYKGEVRHTRKHRASPKQGVWGFISEWGVGNGFWALGSEWEWGKWREDERDGKSWNEGLVVWNGELKCKRQACFLWEVKRAIMPLKTWKTLSY
jgi:hypothetical protein